MLATRVRATRLVAMSAALSASLMVAPALAQQGAQPTTGTSPAAPTAQPPAAPSGTQPSEDKLAEARGRYNRGLQLYNESNFEAARVEFERAYQLAPSYRILYNIGLSYEQLGDYVQALTILQRYLDQGGSEITEERRQEVMKELAQIRPRIARVTLKINQPKAEVLVDDVCSFDAHLTVMNCGPLDGNSRVVLMNPGRRRVTVRLDGFYPETSVLTVAGSDNIEHVINLRPLPVGGGEKKSNPYVVPMWIGWGVTAAGLITAGITGSMALGADSDKEASLGKFGADRAALDDEKDTTRTLATVTDIALIGTGVAAAVSTYFTIKAIGWKGESGGDVNVRVGANHVGIGGHF